MRMYQATDSYLKRLKAFIRREFNHYSTLAFDELNTLRSKKETEATFARLLAYNLTEYRKIAGVARKFALTFLNPGEKKKAEKKGFSEDDIVEEVLLAYNFVTGYLYKPEAERKRLRLAEEIMTAKEFRDRERYRKVVNKGANLWYTQSSQYAITIEDETLLQTWKDAGIKKVQWVTERDDRVCHECRPLDGKVFDIDNVPEKPHYNCRCTLKPVRM